MKSRSLPAALFVVAGLLAAAPAFAQAGQPNLPHHTLLLELNGGPAYTSYDATSNANYAQAVALGYQRVRIGIGAFLGIAAGPYAYLTGGVEAYGDRFFDPSSTYYVQYNTYLWSLGVRVYPFGTGLVLGVQGGSATTSIASDVAIYGWSPPPPGYTWGGLIAYDFGGYTGFGSEIGVRVDYARINGSPFTGATLFFALLWK